MDRSLVERARNGDRDAYEVLAHASAPRLYLAAYRIVRDADQAQDAVQQTLVAMWRELPSLRDQLRRALEDLSVECMSSGSRIRQASSVQPSVRRRAS